MFYYISKSKHIKFNYFLFFFMLFIKIWVNCLPNYFTIEFKNNSLHSRNINQIKKLDCHQRKITNFYNDTISQKKKKRFVLELSTSKFVPKGDRQFRAEIVHHSNQFSLCENNGTFVNGKCHCIYPFVGSRCSDFACEHGLSVGPRYDPESTFFNRKCICDEDWAGELCNIPIADQCNERGQFMPSGRCKCHGYYFGPKCQYVGKCVNGKLQEGRCLCNYGYEGDYCDKIVCHHGYPNKTNNSNSCICPPRHAGIFCDECLLTGDYILPFPNCTEERIPYQARISRKKTDDQIVARLLIIGLTLFLLALLVCAMFLIHWGKKRAAQYDLDLITAVKIGRQKAMLEERKQMLERAIYLQSTKNLLNNDYNLKLLKL